MASEACRLAVISGMAFEAKIAQGAGIRAVYGLDAAKLTTDIEQAIGQGTAGLLSFGTCAGLAPTLQPGTIIIAQAVWCEGRLWPADAAWSARLAAQLPDAQCGVVAGVGQPIKTVAEKARLYDGSGALAADMESQYVAQMAARHKLPFAVLRVVLDDAQCALPPAALVATNRDGSINGVKLAGSLLAHPAQLAAMMRLGANHRAAKNALLRCGELLRGSLFGMDVG